MADGQESNLSSEEENDGQAEPSMEEILSSIRRIISEDDEAEGAKAAGEGDADALDDVPDETLDEADDADEERTENETVDEDDGEDVLELTRMVSEDGSVTDLAEEQEPEAEMATEADETEAGSEEAVTEDALEMQEAELDAPVEAAPAPVKAEAPTPAPETNTDTLLDDTASAAATESFGELTKAVVKEDGPGIQLGSLSDKTLEDLIRELLRPMLKEWLDENLPSITEKLVRKEIERTARRAEEL